MPVDDEERLLRRSGLLSARGRGLSLTNLDWAQAEASALSKIEHCSQGCRHAGP